MGFLRTRSGRPVNQVFAELTRRLESATTEALTAGALVLEAEMKETLSRPGTGAIRRGGRNRLGRGSFNRNKEGKLVMVHRGAQRTNIDPTNRASAPGQPPAPDTGMLRNSITHTNVDSLTVRVGTDLEYAAPLEFGTTSIAPRPFMRPSLAAVKDQLAPAIAGVLKRVIG